MEMIDPESAEYAASSSACILAGIRARFLTDYYNYDNGWPETTAISKTCDTYDSSLDDVYVTEISSSLKRCEEKMDRIEQLVKQVEKAKNDFQVMKNNVASFVTELSFCSQYTVGQLSKYSAKRLDIAQARLARQKKLLDSEQTIRLHLDATLQCLRKDFQPEANEARAKQNRYLVEWNSSRREQYNTPPAVTLRIEVPPLTTHSDRSGFALVRGLPLDGTFGRLHLDNLQAVSCTPEAALLANLATSSASGGVLVSYLQSRLLVDACLNADLTRLRKQYAIDWDPVKRHLHVLTGRADILATLAVSAAGSFRLVRLQHRTFEVQSDVQQAVDALQSKIEEFTAPLSRSLDEWISEVNDFCVGIADSLSA